MNTGFFCPSRQTRASACRSLAGFQSRSKRMRRFAPTRLRPTPPARVDSRKTKDMGPPRLKLSTRFCRLLAPVDPSRRAVGHDCSEHTRSSRSKHCVELDTMTTRSSTLRASVSSCFTMQILAEASSRCSTSGSTPACRKSSCDGVPSAAASTGALHTLRSAVTISRATAPPLPLDREEMSSLDVSTCSYSCSCTGVSFSSTVVSVLGGRNSLFVADVRRSTYASVSSASLAARLCPISFCSRLASRSRDCMMGMV
mmetsp:Transcript_13033/g.41121  ORF Transcript_13033/g.41121 Transcript_13033/m.41121 type:complete len:256 (-) Transcript_13033:1545-2312(-)